MRGFKYILSLVLLFGCTVNSASEIEDSVNKTITSVNKSEAYKNHNHQKGLFSYYLPKNIGVMRANKISTVMLVDNYEVFMALNVSEVMNNKLEITSFFEEDFVLIKQFITINNQGNPVSNKLVIEQLEENQYLIYLKVEEIFFISSVPSAGIAHVLESMLIVSRTVNIDKPRVVAEFSNKEEIKYEKQVIELFSESVPEEGFLKDIYEGEKGDD